MKKKIVRIIVSMLCLSTIFSGCDGNTETETRNTESDIVKDTLPESITVELKESVTEEATEEEKTLFEDAYNEWYRTETEEAINDFKNFIEKYPDSGLADDATYYIGKCYIDAFSPDIDEAINYFSKVITNYPNSSSVPSAYYSIAHIYNYKLNDTDKACLYYVSCIENATVDNEKIVENSIDSLKEYTDIVINYEKK